MLPRPSTAVLRSTRQLATLSSRPTIIPATRLFSTSISHQAEGDTGSTRPGGAAQSDAFSKREKANEDKYMREQESKKIKALREKLSQQESHIKSLKDDLEDLIEDREESEKKK